MLFVSIITAVVLGSLLSSMMCKAGRQKTY